MGAASWLIWLALSAVALAFSIWHYRRRETPGRGRLALALLRAAAVSLLFLLLFDPELPTSGPRLIRGTQVLLDGSLSMTLPGSAGGETRWQRAVAMARQRAGDRPVIVFGERPRPVRPDSLPAAAPADGRSRLLPAVQAAAEAGVRRVVVITDGAIEDAEDVARWAARLGIELEPVRVGDDVANRGLAEITAPAWVASGQPAVVEFGVTGAAEPVTVVARRDGRVIGRTTVAAAGAGRLATGQLELRLEPPSGGGWVRLELALENADAVPDDDARTAYVHVSDAPPGIVLLSLRPDWEVRFLAPVLQQALGLPVRGWIRSLTGQYVRVGSGMEGGTQSREAEVRQALANAELVVLHGLGPEAPPWALEAVTTARGVLIFPAETQDRVPLPLRIGQEQQGDFYVAPNVPSSPVAPLLADLDVSGAAPLNGIRVAELPAGAWTPLNATRGRQGALLPIAAAGEATGRRWAVALGSGYWNWAFRGGFERQLYERLWGSLGGWLIRQAGTASLAAVRPARLAWPRSTPLPWIAPGLGPDSIRVQLSDASGTVVHDTIVRPTTADTAFTTAPAPGHYSYRATAFAGGNVEDASGMLTIERYSPELSRRAVEISAFSGDGTLVRGEGSRPRGTPLHATPYPYMLLLLVLATEWILRRRWGLR